MNAHVAPDLVEICPCCGQSRPAGRTKADAKRLLANTSLFAAVGQERKLLDYFLFHFGEWVPRARQVDIAYEDDPSGGPENAAGVVGQVTHRIRRKVARLGLILEGRPRWGTRLRWGDQEAERAA